MRIDTKGDKMRWMLKTALIFCLISIVAAVSAQPALADDMVDAGTLFNQGNQAFRAGDFGSAVYYYEKAALLDPISNDIQTNLALATERLDTDIVALDPFFLKTWWQYMSGLLMPGGWKVLSVLVLLGLLFFAYRMLVKRVVDRKTKTGLAVCTSLFFLFMTFGISRQNQIYRSPYAVVSADRTQLYMAPDPVSDQVKEVVSGVKLRILDHSADYYKVASMDSEQGWILKDEVQLLRF